MPVVIKSVCATRPFDLLYWVTFNCRNYKSSTLATTVDAVTRTKLSNVEPGYYWNG